MKRQKIIYLITKGNWGGAQRYVYDLATRLPKSHFDVSVLMGQGEELKRKLEAEGISCQQLPSLGRDIKIWGDLKVFFDLLAYFKKERPDIIHLNSSKIGGIGALAGRIYNLQPTTYNLKTKIIFTAHGWAFNEDRPFWQKKVIAFLHWITILLTHQTIVVSNNSASQIISWPGVGTKIRVVHNGLSKLEFLDKEASRLSLLGSATFHNSQIIGTISELHKNKGLDYLIRATAQCQGSPLTLVIIGEGEERTKLEALIKDLKLEDMVFLVGRKENAAQYLKAFDIFALTSITEAFPYVILEAGLAGLPVVASGVGGIPEVINSMESGILIRPKQVPEITKAIDFLLANSTKATRFGRNLKQKVGKEFSTPRMVKQTIEVYNEDHEK